MRIALTIFALLMLVDASQACGRHRHRRHRGGEGCAEAATTGCHEEAATGRTGMVLPRAPIVELPGQPVVAVTAGSCGTEVNVRVDRRQRGRLLRR